MRATSACPYTAAIKAAIHVPPTPFSQVFVTITKQEHIELRLAATQWQGLRRKALATRCVKTSLHFCANSKTGLPNIYQDFDMIFSKPLIYNKILVFERHQNLSKPLGYR